MVYPDLGKIGTVPDFCDANRRILRKLFCRGRPLCLPWVATRGRPYMTLIILGRMTDEAAFAAITATGDNTGIIPAQHIRIVTGMGYMAGEARNDITAWGHYTA